MSASPPGADEFLQWDQASSDPLDDVAGWLIDFRQLTGFAPNICVMGAYVMKALKQHPDIIDRIKYTQRGIVTEDLIATLFDVDELYVTYATQATGPNIPDAEAQDAAATYDFIGDPKGLLFAYAPSSPSTHDAERRLHLHLEGLPRWQRRGHPDQASSARSGSRSDRIEAEQTYDMKVVCDDMGLWVGSAVA